MINVIFLSLGPGYHVININLDLVVNHIVEQRDHGTLISFPRILQPKRLYLVTESAPLCNEGCLLHVFRGHLDLVVARGSLLSQLLKYLEIDCARSKVNCGHFTAKLQIFGQHPHFEYIFII